MRRRRTASDLEGHEFAGWEPAEPLSGDASARRARINEGIETIRDRTATRRLEELLAEIEGDLVPTCACGWRGHAEQWMRPSSRSRRGGQQMITHEFHVRTTAASEQLAAEVAASALRHAVDDWDGDESVAKWLEARADHIERVGRYDAETWPTSE